MHWWQQGTACRVVLTGVDPPSLSYLVRLVTGPGLLCSQVVLRSLSPEVIRRSLKLDDGSTTAQVGQAPTPAVAVSVDAAAGTAVCAERNTDATGPSRRSYQFPVVADTAGVDGGAASLARAASSTAANVVHG